jgi:uncharacterized membrane protein YfcA
MALGAVLGTVVGVLVAGVVHKAFPEKELGILLAAIVALGCFLGALLDGTDFRGKRK